MSQRLIEEYTGLADSALDDVIAAAEADRNRADARIAAAATVIAHRQSFVDDGYRTIRSYLKGTLNCSGSRANRIRRRSDLVDAHPEIGETWYDGHVGTEQIDALARARSHPRAGDRFAEFVAILLDHAEHLTHDDFAAVVERFIVLADSDGAFDDQQAREDERTAHVSIVNGAIDVSAHGGSPLDAEEMKAVFDLAVEAEFANDCAARRAEHGDDALAHPLPRTAQQRKFDALHQIFLAWATVPADAKTPEPLVNLVIDPVTAGRVLAAHGLVENPDLFGVGADAFAVAERDLLARRCHTTTGTAVHPDAVLRALIHGRLRRVVVDADSVVVDMGRTQRLFVGSARNAAQMLVATCTHRGCDIPARFCDVDHRDEWVAQHGHTDQTNAMPACGPHDRWKHAHQIRTRRASNGRIYLIRRDGSVIKPAGEREPDWAEPPPFAAAPPDTTASGDAPPDIAPPDTTASGDAVLGNTVRTITWSEFIRHRPRLADQPDTGWTVLQVDLARHRS